MIIQAAVDCGADLVGFASADRFSPDDAIFKIFPQAKTVVGIAFRVLRGAYRGMEEGTTFYQYSTMGVENMEENIIPTALMQIAAKMEEEDCIALPQRRHQLIMAENDSTNPEMKPDAIYRAKPQEIQMDFLNTAVQCGLGEKSFYGTLLTDDFGPMVRYGFILTDAVLEPSPLIRPHLCDKCGDCIAACPGHAIDKNGTLNSWQCATYYKGANGTKNPFMPKDAYADFEDRLQIIAGEARVTPEKARKVMKATNFYPGVKHGYHCCICGKACDVACYVHLEEKGVLGKTFHTPFRKRKPWKRKMSDFE